MKDSPHHKSKRERERGREREREEKNVAASNINTGFAEPPSHKAHHSAEERASSPAFFAASISVRNTISACSTPS